MKTYLLIFFSTIILWSCTPRDLESLLSGGSDSVTTEEVALGLKEALTRGISIGADLLSAEDGYYKSIYKIMLPEEAQLVADKLRPIPGFSSLEEDVVLKINRAAEDAAKAAKPIFVSAIRKMTIQDAWNILTGAENAATNYLERTTRELLYQEFQPEILSSLNKFGAVDLWEDAATAYNKIPFTQKKANPRIDDHVANKALDGLFSMVAKEEKAIRKDPAKRVTDLLKRVFAKQDA